MDLENLLFRLRSLVAKSRCQLPASPAFLLYVGIYCGLLFWFKRVDLYHDHFDATGWMVATNNVFRILFIFYLFWIIHGAGLCVLRPLAGRVWSEFGILSRLALCFYAGAGVCHIILFVLGFLNLYTVPVAIAFSLPLVILSYPSLAETARPLRASLASLTQSARRRSWRRYMGATWKAAMVLLFTAVSGSLLLVKGLYPAAGHDYAIHYFPYYQRVIALHGLWPNEVWYHFYYSKGAGLYFLGMLLTDPLAPQLVTICFFGASAIALYQLLNRIRPASLWPWAGVLLYVGLYIYTPGTGLFRANGGWGEFEKLHVLNTTLLAGIAWLSAAALESDGRKRLSWAAAACLATAAAVIVNPTVGAYLTGAFGIVLIWHLLRWNVANSAVALACALTASSVMAAIFLVNYLVTGLINDQGMLMFWPYANIETLHQLGTLPKVVLLHKAHVGASHIALPLLPGSILLLNTSLRLDLLYPLVGLGLATAVMALAVRRARLAAPEQTLVLVAMIFVVSALAISAGRFQPVSFFRYSSFTTPLVIACGVILFSVPDWDRSVVVSALGLVGAPLAVLTICGMIAWQSYQPGAFAQVIANAARFATGSLSIDSAYVRQSGWAGRLPWGGIYPGARGAYGVVGPGVRVHTMHVHTYCMLPDCRMEIDDAFVQGDWNLIMFGSPEEARQAWKNAKINYFLFSKELHIVDSIQRSPLFSPDNIARYLGIRWTDGTTALLTWLAPGVTPLNEAWLAAYREKIMGSSLLRQYPYEELRKIFATLEATAHPWGRLKLPWEAEIGRHATPEDWTRVAAGISIVSATYGENCLARPGNATSAVREACNGREFCQYVVTYEALGDPAGGCSKNFVAEFACRPATAVHRQELPAEAGFGSMLTLNCRSLATGSRSK